jgi:hypothetical protein
MLDADRVASARAKVIEVTAPWWSGEFKSDGEMIYGRNMAGSRVPMIWCFQGAQEFVALAHALGSDQPLYGLRSGHMVLDSSLFNLRHLAVACVEDLLSLGLTRPLRLGGNCQGGMLAQKMSEYLGFLGHAVELLVVLNPLCVSPYGGRTELILGNNDITNPTHRFHDGVGVLQANYPRSRIHTIPSEHGKVFQGPTLRALVATLEPLLATAGQTFVGSGMLDEYKAQLVVPDHVSVEPDTFFDMTVQVKNTSAVRWPSSAEGHLWIGNHWVDAQGRGTRWLDGRTALTRGLAPGEEATAVLTLRAPTQCGQHRVVVDLEHAGLVWFSEVGPNGATCSVTVESHPRSAPAGSDGHRA